MMYLLYIDESGVAELLGGTRHFVLCGAAVPAEDWKNCDARISQIKSKYRLRDIELHTGWMARRYLEQEQIQNFDLAPDHQRTDEVEKRRKAFLKFAAATKTQKRVKEIAKQFRKTRPYIHLTLAERRACLRDVADELASWRDLRIFAEVVDKSTCSLSAEDNFQNAFAQVITRFQAFLENRSRRFSQELLGLIIQDNNQTVNLKLTHLMRKYHQQGTLWRDITRIVETPLFVDSNLTSMVQMADFCAYAIRRFFDDDETDLFDRIYSKFDRSGDRVVGLRHFTGSNPCSCKVCKDHGR